MINKQKQNKSFLAKCKEHGLKITPQRCAIYSELIGDTSHPTAEQVYRRIKGSLPNISLDTVNRTLINFASIGLLGVVPGRDKATRFDPGTGPHGHFQCIKCLKIIDFEESNNNVINIPSFLEENIILNEKIIIEGICKSCK